MRIVRKLGLILLAVGLFGVAAPGAAPPAAAAGDFACGFTAVTDATGFLGGQTTWRGTIDLLYVPPAGQSATVSCELFVDGSSQGIKLGPTNGTGVVVDAAPLTFTAGDNEPIVLCTHVTVAGVPQPDMCSDPNPPGPFDVVNGLIENLDPAICDALVLAAPTVNGVDPTVLRIDPTYGDVYVLGEPFWDCPPYEG